MEQETAIFEKKPALCLDGRYLLGLARHRGAENMNQISRRSGVSYPTVHRYLSEPQRVNAIDLDTFYQFLRRGLGLTRAEIMSLRLGDIFSDD